MPPALKNRRKKDTGIVYTKLPALMGVSKYDAARRWVIDFFSKIKEVAAVYEYGTVKTPGISDLDLMVVLKDGIKNRRLYDKLKFKDVPKDLSFLVNNGAVKFIEKKHFKDINKLGEFRKKLLCGEDIKCNPVSARDKKFFRIALVMDFLPERVLTLLRYREGKKIPVVDLMGIFKSFLYSAKMAQELTQTNTREVDEFEKSVNCAREGWFTKKSREKTGLLLRLIDEAERVGAKISQDMALFLLKNRYYSPVKNARYALFLFDGEKAFSFYGLGKKYAFKKTFFNGTSVILPVPAVWLSHIYFYGQHKGIISSRIRHNFILRKSVENAGVGRKMSEILSFRINVCNEMAQSFRKLGIPTSKLYRFAQIQSVKF